jgi:hypothetical protein
MRGNRKKKEKYMKWWKDQSYTLSCNRLNGLRFVLVMTIALKFVAGCTDMLDATTVWKVPGLFM